MRRDFALSKLEPNRGRQTSGIHGFVPELRGIMVAIIPRKRRAGIAMKRPAGWPAAEQV
jgi:hypothetical protein